MKVKNIAIFLIILGVIMFLYNSFNFKTTEKVVDIGPIKINKEVNHPLTWSPIMGGVLVVGGIVLLLAGAKKIS